MTQVVSTQSPARRAVPICTALLLVVALLAPVATSVLRPRPVAAVAFSASNRIMASPRGTPEKALHFAQSHRSSRITEVYAFIREAYRLGPLIGMDPAIVVAQSAHETGNWTSFYWREHLNPAGIGITSSGVPSATWANGTDAARAQMVHLYLYAVGRIPSTHRLYPYISLDPRYSAALSAGYAGTSPTLNDLTGRWATDPSYGVNVARRGNEIYLALSTDPTDPGLAVQTVGASGGTGRLRTRDGDPATGWAVTGTSSPPASGWLTYDLGADYRLSTIQWLFSTTGNADSWDLQISRDSVTWRGLARYANAPARSWTRYTTAVTGRYVRFLLRNPNGDMTLGSLGEVEFYGVRSTTLTTPTATPIPLSGSRLTIVGSGGSSIGNGSRRVRDGDLRTTWETTSSTPPRQAQVYVDVGAVGTVTGVEWMFRRTSGAASYSIQVSRDKVVWTTISTQAGSTPLAWQRTAANKQGRYVRFLFTNPTNTLVLGYLAEIRVYGTPGTFTTAQAPTTATTTPTAASTTPSVAPTGTATPSATASPEPTSTPVATETPTVTPEPTSTPMATETPTVTPETPTVTPEPTSTPVATETLTVAPDAE